MQFRCNRPPPGRPLGQELPNLLKRLELLGGLFFRTRNRRSCLKYFCKFRGQPGSSDEVFSLVNHVKKRGSGWFMRRAMFVLLPESCQSSVYLRSAYVTICTRVNCPSIDYP